AVGEDAALDELVRIAIWASLDDPARHARRDAGQPLDATERGGVQIDRRRTLGLGVLGVPAMQEAAPGKRHRRDEREREDARPRHGPATVAGPATSVEQPAEPVAQSPSRRSDRTSAAADLVAERGPYRAMELARHPRLGPREKGLVPFA